MKKFLSIILVVFYLVLISGVTLQLHYCGGKLTSVKFTLQDKSHSCACGSKAMKKGCCKNQTVYVKVKGDQKSSSNFIIPSDNGRTIALQLNPYLFKCYVPQHFSNITNYHAPPPRYSNSMLIFNSTFRI